MKTYNKIYHRDVKTSDDYFFRKVTLFTIFVYLFSYEDISESVIWRCSVKKTFIEISQNSQENACARVSFLIKF